jgi:hypothetical protein
MTQVLNRVTSVFSNVSTRDSFNDKYSLVVQLTEEQAADAEDAGLAVKTKEYQGNTQYQVSFRSKFKPEIRSPSGKDIIDLDGREIDRGAMVSVQYNFRDWTGPTGNTGTSQDLDKIQLISDTSSSAAGFEDQSGFEESTGAEEM